MVLNYIWIGFFLVGLLVALMRSMLEPAQPVMHDVVIAVFEISEVAVMNVALPLMGIIIFWMGMMRIGEKGGAVGLIGKGISPFLSKIFKGVPKDHPAHGSIVMNFSANMLGLDNAATPMGLKAMEQLQELNPKKDTASDAQIMFLVLNTSGLTLIPTSIIGYQVAYKAADPTDVFLPILIATACSSLFGLLVVSLIQRINLLRPAIILTLLGVSGLIAGLIGLITSLPEYQMEATSQTISATFILGFIAFFLILGFRKKLNLYEEFVEGAKEGINVTLRIIPYLVAMLASIAVFRASGALDYVLEGITWVVHGFSSETRFVDALPVALMKPLSGSGARALMIDTWGAVNDAGAAVNIDTFKGKLAAVFQGSTETTFYVLAVYFGSVNIRNTRYAAGAGLLADLAGIIAAIIVAYAFFG